jgi:hypothetical protein
VPLPLLLLLLPRLQWTLLLLQPLPLQRWLVWEQLPQRQRLTCCCRGLLVRQPKKLPHLLLLPLVLA